MKTEIGRSLVREIKAHAPFTLVGATSGILLLLFLRYLPWDIGFRGFYTLHPAHVLFSGMVTGSLFARHRYCGDETPVRPIPVLVFGTAGAIGVATLSDSILPFAGEWLLDLPNRAVHIGVIEKWWLVNPLAFAGAVLALMSPQTRLPHAAHVLLSTYASLFHVLMAMGPRHGFLIYLGIFGFLFVCVWLPCCLSDLILPVAVGEARGC